MQLRPSEVSKFSAFQIFRARSCYVSTAVPSGLLNSLSSPLKKLDGGVPYVGNRSSKHQIRQCKSAAGGVVPDQHAGFDIFKKKDPA